MTLLRVANNPREARQHIGSWSKAAFTLAEVLITLAIIGVVAAITIPNLIVEYQIKETVSKLQKAYSVLSQMMLKSYSDNGAASTVLTPNTEVTAEITKAFFDTYWLPYFNSPVVIPEQQLPYSNEEPYKSLDGEKYVISVSTIYNRGRVYFKTQDGISYFVFLMEWENEYDNDGNLITHIAKYKQVQLIYVDINGRQGPNIIGKDVFVFLANFQNNTIRPYCYAQSKNYVNNNCSKNSSGLCCSSKIILDGWKINNDYPW